MNNLAIVDVNLYICKRKICCLYFALFFQVSDIAQLVFGIFFVSRYYCISYMM